MRHSGVNGGGGLVILADNTTAAPNAGSARIFQYILNYEDPTALGGTGRLAAGHPTSGYSDGLSSTYYNTDASFFNPTTTFYMKLASASNETNHNGTPGEISFTAIFSPLPE